MSEEPSAGLVEVRLLGLPVQVWAAFQEHTDGLLREFALITAGSRSDEPGHGAVPARLLALVDRLTRQFAGVGEVTRTQLFAAAASGRTSIDVTYQAPHEAADACIALDRMLDEADEYCRAGRELLSLATPPDQLVFRRWYLGEFVAQVGGAPPTAWEQHRAAGPTAG